MGWATKYTFFWGWRLNATFGHWMSLSLQRRLMERTMDSDGKWVVNRGRSTRHVTHALRFLPVSYDISTHSFPRSVTEGTGNGRSLLSCFFVPIPWVCALDFLLSLSHYTRSYPCQKWLVNRLWIQFVLWICFLPIGNFTIPIDFHIFQRGRYTTNQIMIIILFWLVFCATVLIKFTCQPRGRIRSWDETEICDRKSRLNCGKPWVSKHSLKPISSLSFRERVLVTSFSKFGRLNPLGSTVPLIKWIISQLYMGYPKLYRSYEPLTI